MAQALATRRNEGRRLVARRDHPLERLARDFDTLFGRLWGDWLAPFDQNRGTVRLWDFDVSDDEKEVVVRAELPGFDKDELDVQLSNNVLTVKAEKEQKGDREEEYRSFYRMVTLPPGIDAEKVQATYQNGVLELHIPKKEEAQAKRISIQGQQGGSGQRGQQALSNQSGAAGSQMGGQRQQPDNQTGATASEKARR
jgi:HSP20 family protein